MKRSPNINEKPIRKLNIIVDYTAAYVMDCLTNVKIEFFGKICQFPSCQGFDKDRRYLCIACRIFFHEEHECFEEKPNENFKICKKCSILYLSKCIQNKM